MKKIFFILLTGIFPLQVMATPVTAPLSGTWLSKCLPMQDQEYFVRSIEIHENIWTFTDEVFLDQSCVGLPQSEFQTMYKVALDGQNWDGVNLMITYRPLTSAAVKKFNTESLCGMQSWARGHQVEVADLNCRNKQMPKLEAALFSIYKVEGPKNTLLWIGDSDNTHSGDSEATRFDHFSELSYVRDPSSF